MFLFLLDNFSTSRTEAEHKRKGFTVLAVYLTIVSFYALTARAQPVDGPYVAVDPSLSSPNDIDIVPQAPPDVPDVSVSAELPDAPTVPTDVAITAEYPSAPTDVIISAQDLSPVPTAVISFDPPAPTDVYISVDTSVPTDVYVTVDPLPTDVYISVDNPSAPTDISISARDLAAAPTAVVSVDPSIPTDVTVSAEIPSSPVDATVSADYYPMPSHASFYQDPEPSSTAHKHHSSTLPIALPTQAVHTPSTNHIPLTRRNVPTEKADMSGEHLAYIILVVVIVLCVIIAVYPFFYFFCIHRKQEDEGEANNSIEEVAFANDPYVLFINQEPAPRTTMSSESLAPPPPYENAPSYDESAKLMEHV